MGFIPPTTRKSAQCSRARDEHVYLWRSGRAKDGLSSTVFRSTEWGYYLGNATWDYYVGNVTYRVPMSGTVQSAGGYCRECCLYMGLVFMQRMLHGAEVELCREYYMLTQDYSVGNTYCTGFLDREYHMLHRVLVDLAGRQ